MRLGTHYINSAVVTMSHAHSNTLLLLSAGHIVARVRLDRVNKESYTDAFRAIFHTVEQDYPDFKLGTTLNGIILDWSDSQYAGLAGAIGPELAEQLVKGCRVSSTCTSNETASEGMLK